MISTRQLKILQNVLGKRFKDREERMAFLSDSAQRELSSSKELTEGDFFGLLDWLAMDGILSYLIGQLVIIAILNSLELPSLIDRRVKRYTYKLE